jgi:hypothetical protein
VAHDDTMVCSGMQQYTIVYQLRQLDEAWGMMGSMFMHGTKYSPELDLQSDCPWDRDREFGMIDVLYDIHVSSV